MYAVQRRVVLQEQAGSENTLTLPPGERQNLASLDLSVSSVSSSAQSRAWPAILRLLDLDLFFGDYDVDAADGFCCIRVEG